jgi:hypothetical protein
MVDDSGRRRLPRGRPLNGFRRRVTRLAWLRRPHWRGYGLMNCFNFKKRSCSRRNGRNVCVPIGDFAEPHIGYVIDAPIQYTRLRQLQWLLLSTTLGYAHTWRVTGERHRVVAVGYENRAEKFALKPDVGVAQMAHFIMTREGSVNLDHVARTKPAADGNGERLYDKDGELLGVTYGEIPTGTFVPAAPGFYATVITVDSIGHRPTEKDVWAERMPVAAWRIDEAPESKQEYATPILPDGMCGNQVALVELPDGRLCNYDSTYDGIVDAKATILLYHQNEWDRRHGEKKECAAP